MRRLSRLPLHQIKRGIGGGERKNTRVVSS
nr:MAG TPA: hypothetical protein [Caudoviricetes sp.]